VKFSWAIAVIIFASHAFGETGRWAGQWVIENGAEVTEVDANDADSPSLEGEVSEAASTCVFTDPPRGFLVDADELLSPEASADRLAFLRHHAEDSKIGLYVYVFGEGVHIPSDTGVERFFAEQSAAMVYYFMGEPQRSGFYLSPQLTEVVSEAEQRRSLQSSIMQAADKNDPEAQLEAFLVQISIRLYWMEQMMDEGTSKSTPQMEIELNPVQEPDDAVVGFPLPADWLPWTAAGGMVVLSLPCVWWLRRERARYRFPEFEVEPRLGGRYAAGVGAVISYLSLNVPPAAQRDQVLDDRHRT